eukprot:2839182-Ditylum_brightwellii.AAC.1
MDNLVTLDQTAEKYSTVQEQMHKREAEDMSKSITYKTLVMIALKVIKPKEVYPPKGKAHGTVRTAPRR